MKFFKESGLDKEKLFKELKKASAERGDLDRFLKQLKKEAGFVDVDKFLDDLREIPYKKKSIDNLLYELEEKIAARRKAVEDIDLAIIKLLDRYKSEEPLRYEIVSIYKRRGATISDVQEFLRRKLGEVISISTIDEEWGKFIGDVAEEIGG